MRPQLILALATAAIATAQTTGTATMSGAVTDPTGSLVPAAKITVVNSNTNFVFTSTTSTEGTWYIPNLNPGFYQLKIEAQGFKSHIRDGIQLRTAESPRFDVALEVGNVTESVQVTGTAPLLETETSTSGQVLEGETITKIPVLQKAFYRIYLYMPGMNVIGGQHAVGQRQRSLGYNLDGVNAKESVFGNPNAIDTVVTASLDAIQEFKMYTTGLPAEFGHSSGGQLSGVFKSGTNQLHGSAEDRYLNGRLVHRQYFEQLQRCQGLVACNPFTYHEMGATLGGPVYIPKIYNGKDKTFFFFGFQRHHEKVTETFQGAVPSPEMYNGDFSFGGRGFPIYDPASTRMENGAWVRTPFPGNIIPRDRFDPVALNILQRNPWKQPNDPGSVAAGGPANNLVVPTKGRYYITRFDVKIDHQFSPSNKVFGRVSTVTERIPGRFSNELLWSLVDPVYWYPIDMTNVVISDTHTFTPTLINEFRFGFNRRYQLNLPPTQDGDWGTQLGMPNVSPETFPDILNPSNGRYYNLGPGGMSERTGTDYTFQNNTTWITGKHTLKFGYELLRTTYDILAESFPSGRYFMGGTEQPFTPNTGNPFASFLLGYVSQAQFTRAQGTWSPRWYSNSLYLQDDWKPTRNLTLNLGLRWMYETPFNTGNGLISQFDPTAMDPLTGRTGAILHNPGPLAKRDLNNFQPRLGIAWNFRPNWVFRGNFGVITSDIFTATPNNNFEEYLATANVQAPVGDPRPVFRLSQGPPNISFTTNPDGSVPYVGTNFGARNASWWDPNMRNPYVMNWSAGIQYQFTNTWLMELQYQGSAGIGLLNYWDINVQPLDFGAPADRVNIRNNYQNFKPFPQFGAIRHYSNYGHNTYHGSTVRLEKRYSSGVTLNTFWTFSKAINNVDEDGEATGITWYNRSLEKGRANYDTTHRFVVTGTWELPVGKGKRYMNRGGWANAIFGGWELVASQHFISGQPFNLSFAGSPNLYYPGASRPDMLRPADEVQQHGVDIGPDRFPFSRQNRYLDYTAFEYPAAFAAGTLGRNVFEAPGVIWMQTSLAKEWVIRERLRFSLRFDVNNPYKYHSFNPPDGTFNRTNLTSACPAGLSTCPVSFGTFNGTRGSFSDIGTGRWHGIMVFRVAF